MNKAFSALEDYENKNQIKKNKKRKLNWVNMQEKTMN